MNTIVFVAAAFVIDKLRTATILEDKCGDVMMMMIMILSTGPLIHASLFLLLLLD